MTKLLGLARSRLSFITAAPVKRVKTTKSVGAKGRGKEGQVGVVDLLDSLFHFEKKEKKRRKKLPASINNRKGRCRIHYWVCPIAGKRDEKGEKQNQMKENDVVGDFKRENWSTTGILALLPDWRY